MNRTLWKTMYVKKLYTSSRIARRAEQGARPAKPIQVAVEKLVTVSNTNKITCLLKGKKKLQISTLNVQTLNKIGKTSELLLSSMDTKQDVIGIQEHRFMHLDVETKEHNIGDFKLITCSAWKNSINATIGGIGILLNKNAYNSLNCIEKISNRILVAHFNGNPKATITVCYSPTNVSEQSEIETFYE